MSMGYVKDGFAFLIADDVGRHVLIIALVGLRPRLCAAKPRLLRAGQDHAELRMLEGNAPPFHLVQDRHTDIAAGQVVVCSVHHAFRIVGDHQQQKERHKEESAQSRYPGPIACAAEGKDGQRKVVLFDVCAECSGFCFFSSSKHVAEILPAEEPGEDGEEILGHIIHVSASRHDHDELLHLG